MRRLLRDVFLILRLPAIRRLALVATFWTGGMLLDLHVDGVLSFPIVVGTGFLAWGLVRLFGGE